MAESRQTTGAVHITELDVGITKAVESLREFQEKFQETVNLVNSTKIEIGGSGADGGGRTIGQQMAQDFGQATESAQQLSNTVTKFFNQTRDYKGIAESLRLDDVEEGTKKLRNLFNQLEDFKNVDIQTKDGELFKAVVTSADEAGRAVRRVIDLTEEFDKEYLDSSTKVTERGNQTSEALKKEAISVEELTQKYNALQVSTSSLAAVISGTKIENTAVEELKKQSADLANQVKETSTAIQSGNMSAEEMDRTYSKLNTTFNTVLKLWNEVTREANNSSKGVSTSVKQVESLNLSYKNFLNTLTKTKLTDTALGNIPEQAQSAAQRMSALTETVKRTGKVTGEQQKEFDKLNSVLKDLKGQLADAEANARRTGEGFKNLGQNADQSASAISKFIGALSDKVKWMAAFQVINLIQNGFGNVISTIKETEDAVIEIQRVLNDPSLADSTVSQRIYDIAYEYGQTFENVQEVFVRFAQAGLDFNEATKATEAAMLGLNTAELDVSTATQGLIAIMAQFGYTADDLTSIIDKINITADNFAVTSEKIVAGLQRAGGTAHAFGLSLEETIGIITALSEATGRSGEQIGTALNSLISFSQKESVLEKFSNFLGQDVSDANVLTVWTLLADKIQGGSEELADFMAKNEEFSTFLNEDLANALGLQEEYNQALTNEKDVIGAVGTYRQNYFIALLNNIQTAIEAIENMDNAMGYSAKENETAMSRLTAQWNQLVVAAQELAVQFGEAGFLDILKWIADVSTGILKATKYIGGFKTALWALVTVLAAVKAQKIAEYFDNSNSLISRAIYWIKAATTSWKDFKAAMQLGVEAFKNWATSFSGAVSIIGTGITLFTAITSAIDNYRQAQEEARQASIEAGKVAEEQVNSITSLQKAFDEANKEYEKTGQKTDALTQSADALVAKLQEEGVIIEKVDDAYEYLAGHIEEVTEKTKELLSLEIGKYYDALESAEDSLLDKFRSEFFASGSALTGHKYTIDLGVNISYDEGQEVYEYLKSLGFNVSESGLRDPSGLSLGIDVDLSTPEAARTSYGELLKIVSSLGEKYTQAFLNSQDWYKELRDGLIDLEETVNAYDGAKKRVDAYEGALETSIEKTEEAANANDDLTTHLFDVEKQLKGLGDEYERVSGKLSGLQSAYGTLISAVDEYNDTGIMTSEMLEELLQLEPEYISLLEVKNGQLSLNKYGVDALVNSTDVYMQQMVALKIAEEAEALAKEMQEAAANDYTLAQLKAQAATAAFSSELYTAVLNMIQGKGTADELAHALGDVSASAQLSGEWLEYFNGQFQSIFSGYAQLLSLPRSFKLPSSSYKPASSTGKSGSSASDEIKKQKEALQAEIKAYQDREKEIKNYYSELKKTTQDYYDGLINELKQVQEENSRINAQLDYYNSRQKIITNLEQAQARSGVEWREKEMEYQQQLIDLDDEWSKKQEDWSIEDRIEELTKLKEFAVKQIEEAMNTAVDEITKVIEELQEKVNKLSSSVASSVSSGISSGASVGATFAGQSIDELFSKVTEMAQYGEEKAEKGVLRAKEGFATLSALMQKQLGEEIPALAYGGAQKSFSMYREQFTEPLSKEFIQMVKLLRNSTSEGAQEIYQAYKKNLTDPLRQDLLYLFKQATNEATNIKAIIGSQMSYLNSFSAGLGQRGSSTTNFSMYNNINSTSAANATVNTALGRLNSFR